MYGQLTVVTGPMFSGKTTTLIDLTKKIKNYVVYKPIIDSRYSSREIVTHDGVKINAISIHNTMPIIPNDIKHVIIDEIQFFSDDIVQWIKSQLDLSINFTVGGLNMDWTGNPFSITGNLMAMADVIIKKKSSCSVCGNVAAKTIKTSDFDSIIDIGGSDKYEARCNLHFTWKADDEI